MLPPSSGHTSTLKMGVAGSFKTFVTSFQMTQYHNSESPSPNLQYHRDLILNTASSLTAFTLSFCTRFQADGVGDKLISSPVLTFSFGPSSCPGVRWSEMCLYLAENTNTTLHITSPMVKSQICDSAMQLSHSCSKEQWHGMVYYWPVMEYNEMRQVLIYPYMQQKLNVRISLLS
jgi:hypothetical protein